MKRLLPLLLALLLLAGCAAGNQESTNPPSSDTQSTVPTGLYDPENPVEAGTNGAVRAYPLKADTYTGLTSMGSRLLLIGDDGSLTALKGEDCQVTATMLTSRPIHLSAPDFDTATQGAAYYIESTREVVMLNPQLQQSTTWVLPEEILGVPAISLVSDEVYYSAEGELRALNLQTGISRLVRSHPGTSLTIVARHFDGAVLECTDAEGQRIYISSQTGEKLSTDTRLMTLASVGQSYFAELMDGGILTKIFGTMNSTAQALNVEGASAAALELSSAVIYETNDSGLQLELYDLTTGRHRSSVLLPGVTDPVTFAATDSHLWALAWQDGHQVLFRWDTGRSLTGDDTVYSSPLTTASAPDEEGLNACQSRVVDMNQKYGVRIHIWQDAVKNPGSLTLTAEYQVPTINKMLDTLETYLEKFPADFLKKTVETGWVHICLVRDVGNGENYAQYWHDGDCYIAISYDTARSFLEGVAFAIDTHVLGNSRDFDDWQVLNPDGFAYTGGADPDTAFLPYLGGEYQAFTDIESMYYPHVDRSHLFAAAMLDGNAELFGSTMMQSKLRVMCEGIREAYGLEKSAEEYPWEQYLATSLAYSR